MAPRQAPWWAVRFPLPCAVAACVASAAGAVPALSGQASGTLGIGASVVRYEGFLTAGAAVLLPSVRFDTPRLSLGAQGNVTVFETGTEVVQGTLGAAWLAGSSHRWRVELAGSAGASRYADEPGSGHVLGSARFHLFGSRTGGWLGGTVGRSSGNGGATPVALTAAGWTVQGGVAVVATVTSTWYDGDRYLDVLGALRYTGSRLEIEARAGARPWTRSAGEVGDAVSGVFGDLTAHVPLTAGLGLTLGGGTYPSDPARRVLGARYFNLGLRVRAFGARGVSDARLEPGLLRRAAPARPASSAPAQLQVAAAAGRLAIRVRAAGVRTVEVMGDFTDWAPLRLVEVQPGQWQVELAVAPGIHRLNVRLDGGAWIVPAGVRAEPTEFGGQVGIIVVPF